MILPLIVYRPLLSKFKQGIIMLINYIDVTEIFKQESDCKMLLRSANKYLKKSKNNAIRYDIICSLFLRRRFLKLKNAELCKFIKEFLPRNYVVYKLYADEELVYVGVSCDVHNRISTHHRDKNFNKVVVCAKNTKEEALNLENTLIHNHLPKYNKSAILSRVQKYKGDLSDEKFIPFCEYLWEIPVRRASLVNSYMKYVEGKMFKYGTETLNSDGKKQIARYHIQVNNSIMKGYDEGYCKVEIPKEDVGKSVLSLLKKYKLFKYVVEDSPTSNLHTFDGYYIFSCNKYRIIGKTTWYTTTPSNIVNIFKEHIDNRYGKLGEPLSRVFNFGKHKNKKVEDVEKEDPEYIKWCHKNLEKHKLLQLGLITQEESNKVFETVFDRLEKSHAKLEKLREKGASPQVIETIARNLGVG